MEGRDASISSLRFIEYVVSKVEYKANLNAEAKEKLKLEFNINNITKINEEKNKMQITLNVEVFKNVENAPIFMN